MKEENQDIPSAARMVAVGTANAVVSGLVNAKLEPYNLATLQVHLGKPQNGASSSNNFKVGSLSTIRSFMIGVNAINGPGILQAKGLTDVQAENVVTAGTVAINTVFKHGIMKIREKEALTCGKQVPPFTYGMGTTVFTTMLQQKAFLSSMRHVHENNVGEDGKLGALGLASSVAQVSAVGGVVSPVAHLASTYSRYPEEVAKQLKNSWESNGFRGVARVAFPKQAVIAGAVGYGVSSFLSAVGRDKVRNPLDDKTQDKLNNYINSAETYVERVAKNASSDLSDKYSKMMSWASGESKTSNDNAENYKSEKVKDDSARSR